MKPASRLPNRGQGGRDRDGVDVVVASSAPRPCARTLGSSLVPQAGGRRPRWSARRSGRLARWGPGRRHRPWPAGQRPAAVPLGRAWVVAYPRAPMPRLTARSLLKTLTRERGCQDLRPCSPQPIGAPARRCAHTGTRRPVNALDSELPHVPSDDQSKLRTRTVEGERAA